MHGRVALHRTAVTETDSASDGVFAVRRWHWGPLSANRRGAALHRAAVTETDGALDGMFAVLRRRCGFSPRYFESELAAEIEQAYQDDMPDLDGMHHYRRVPTMNTHTSISFHALCSSRSSPSNTQLLDV